MRPGLATILRLAGPLIEVACIATLFQVRGRGYRVFGLSAESLLFAGIAAGVVLVVIGVLLSRKSYQPVDHWDVPKGST